MTQSKLPITVLVQTKNEEVGIAACLAALTDFDEVVVVDSDSTDRTKEIAAASGASVVNFSWNGQYPKKKQWQLDNLETRNDWVLFIDADETPTEQLLMELPRVLDNLPGDVAAFDIDLDYVFSGRLLRHGHRVTKRSLVRRGMVRYPVVDDLDAPGMGELEGHYQPLASGSVRRLRGRILHNDLDPVSTWFARHNRYSDWEAYLRARQQARTQVRARRTFKGQVFDSIPFKPLVFFVYAYIARAGFLDGRAGLDYALALSTYYWQIGLKTRDLRRASVLERDAHRHGEAESRLSVVQFVNTLAVSDGGPARNSFELNLALNATDDVSAHLRWFEGGRADSVLDGYAGRLPPQPPERLPSRSGIIASLWREIGAADVAIIHGYYLWWVPIVVLISHMRRTPAVLMPHGALTDHQRRQSVGRKRLFELAAGWMVRRGVDRLAVGSERERTELIGLVAASKISVVGVGTNVSAIERPSGWGVPLKLLTLGRIAPKKRIDISLGALAVLKGMGVSATLVVAGDGPAQQLEALKASAARLGVAELVDFVGHVTFQKPELLQAADIFLLPSDDENFGIAAAEALASGLPVVVSENVAAADGLPSLAGERIGQPSAQSMADAIVRIRSRDADEVRARAALFGSDRFSWTAVARCWIDVLHRSAGVRKA